MKKPNFRQWLAYNLGGTLPEELNEWVRNDLVGHWAMEKYLARFLVPTVPLMLLVFLLPGEIWIKITMLAMMVVPLVVFTVSLSYVYRRFRLAQHGLEPGLLNRVKYSDLERLHYQERYGHQ